MLRMFAARLHIAPALALRAALRTVLSMHCTRRIGGRTWAVSAVVNG